MGKVSHHGYIGFTTSGAGVGVLRIHDLYNSAAFPIPLAEETLSSLFPVPAPTAPLQIATLALLTLRDP